MRSAAASSSGPAVGGGFFSWLPAGALPFAAGFLRSNAHTHTGLPSLLRSQTSPQQGLNSTCMSSLTPALAELCLVRASDIRDTSGTW